MNADILRRLQAMETTPASLQRTREYLMPHVRTILQPNEQVLICYPDEGPASLGGLLGDVARSCGCAPIHWGPDYRWKSLLRLAFDSHASSIIGPPLVVLGLMKTARATATPLNIHNALLCGYPYASWIIEAIKRGLDCRIWGCYQIGEGPVVAGITCTKEAGIHVRGSVFEARICDADGTLLEDARRGYLTLRYKPCEDLELDMEESGKIWHQPCSCGCDDPRVVETVYVGDDDPTKSILEDRFLDWAGVLDYRVTRDAGGTGLEMVVFPDAILPSLQSFTRITVRTWDPEEDWPFCMEKYRK